MPPNRGAMIVATTRQLVQKYAPHSRSVFLMLGIDHLFIDIHGENGCRRIEHGGQ